jgi:hypothetical protein
VRSFKITVTNERDDRVAEVVLAQHCYSGEQDQWFITATVDLGPSVGHYSSTVYAPKSNNPLGALRSALSCLAEEGAFVEGEIVDVSDDNPPAGPPALARGLSGEVHYLPTEEERGLRYYRPTVWGGQQE